MKYGRGHQEIMTGYAGKGIGIIRDEPAEACMVFHLKLNEKFCHDIRKKDRIDSYGIGEMNGDWTGKTVSEN